MTMQYSTQICVSRINNIIINATKLSERFEFSHQERVEMNESTFQERMNKIKIKLKYDNNQLGSFISQKHLSYHNKGHIAADGALM